MAWRSGWRGGRRAGCSSPQATAAGSHRPSLPCAADRLGRAVDRDAPRRWGPEAAAVVEVVEEVVEGVVVVVVVALRGEAVALQGVGGPKAEAGCAAEWRAESRGKAARWGGAPAPGGLGAAGGGGGVGVAPPMGGEVVGGVLVASAGLPPQATSVPASGMAAIPLSTRRRAVKFVPLFSSWFIALGDWGGQSSVPFGRSIGNSRQTLCQAGRPAKNGRCAGFYAQRSQTRTGK